MPTMAGLSLWDFPLRTKFQVKYKTLNFNQHDSLVTGGRQSEASNNYFYRGLAVSATAWHNFV